MAARARLSRQSRDPGVRRSRRRLRVLRAHGSAAPRARLRHRRRRREGRRSRAARGDGYHVARAALGDRVQVPAGGEDHAAARHHGEHRSHRARHRSRCSSRCSSAVRTSGWRRCTTRTTSRARTCARRHRDRAARRRCDPRGRRAGPHQAPEGHAPLEVPDQVPGVRGATRTHRGRGEPPLRERRLPGAAGATVGALGRPRRDGHRGAGRGARTASSSTRGCSRTRPTSTRSPSIASCRSSGSASAPRNSSSTRSRPRSDSRCGACSSGSGSTTSDRPPRRHSRSFPDLDAIEHAGADALTAIDGVGPTIAQSIGQWFSIDRNRRLVTRLKEAGVNLIGDAGPGDRSDRRLVRRHDVRAHQARSERHTRMKAGAEIVVTLAARSPAASRRRRATSSSARVPARS